MQGPINLGHVMSAHAKFSRAHAEALKREMEGAGKFGVGYVAQHPTFRPRTGDLQKQTRSKVVRLKSGAVIRLFNRSKYGKFVEWGTKAHGPKRAKYMRFIGRNGSVVYAKWVRGIKPYKFLYRATVATGRVFEVSMRARMDLIARGF